MNAMKSKRIFPWAIPVMLLAFACVVGCPSTPEYPTTYEEGFEAGFAKDSWYWDGYYDGYDTLSNSPIYYDASGIPYVTSPPYDAGYYDGVWYAYNDGYFVDYTYAFILGFSEGYDNAYWPDYLEFLDTDQHTELGNGGWTDGYNDGFTEGRVFGANDYEQGLPLDWMDALLDYQSGTDLYFYEVGVGTGAYGPAVLYEYGVDPNEAKSAVNTRPTRFTRSVRSVPSIKEVDLSSRVMFRTLTAEAQSDLQVTPEKSKRDGSVKLRLTTSWLTRINTYIDSQSKAILALSPERNREVK